MEAWHLTLIIAGAQFAATIGGMLVALRYQDRRVTEVKESVSHAHRRLDAHQEWHAQKAA